VAVPPSIGELIATALRRACVDAGWSQRELARRLGTNPSAVKRLLATGSPTLDVGLASAALLALGLRISIDRGGLGLVSRSAQRDAVHAWCCAYVVRRLRRAAFEVATEVEIGDGRTRGWIDGLAYRKADRVVLCIEVKTVIDDAGRILRSLSWNVRSAREAAIRLGWRPARIMPILLLLSTAETEERLVASAQLFRSHLPGGARSIVGVVDGAGAPLPRPALR
jgi:transcriptional regulator with XRE-family HTH domain